MAGSSGSPARILIVGAGSMGIITGYHLDLAGAEVTFLVRPHRVEALGRPQILYSYDDVTLREFSGYEVIADLAAITRDTFDYVLITLDGAALHSPDGLAMVRAISDAVRDTATKVVVGTVGLDVIADFLKLSGLPQDQVALGALNIMAHPVAGVTLPLHAPTDPDLLAQADLAYGHNSDSGFDMIDSVPDIAAAFADLYNANGESHCGITSVMKRAVKLPVAFPVFVACELIDWPDAANLGKDPELLELTARSVREILDLSYYGEAGQKAKEATTAESIVAMWTAWEAATRPLDLQAFNRYHHGGKVSVQDWQLLLDWVAMGEANGRPMTSLKELLTRVADHRDNG